MIKYNLMNYLAHIFYSGDDYELMVNNLFGDFVKGRNIGMFSLKIQNGIELHRSLDNFIDTHSSIKLVKKEIAESLPKVYSIAIDLFYDHYLAKNWKNYHKEDYNLYLDKFFKYLEQVPNNYNDEFYSFLSLLNKKRWLYYYSSLFGLYKLSKGVSNKINFKNELFKAHFVYVENQNYIDTIFEEFTESAISVFLKK